MSLAHSIRRLQYEVRLDERKLEQLKCELRLAQINKEAPHLNVGKVVWLEGRPCFVCNPRQTPTPSDTIL